MNVNGVNGNSAASNATEIATAARKNVGDQETFLKLLIAQMKNQDPLNPQDSTAFVAQLAQFSSLEQLTGINQKLDRLVDLGKK